MREDAMRLAITGLVAIGLAGCSTTDAGPPTDMVADGSQTALCDPAPVQRFVGQRADATSGAAILKDSGARALRWGPPGGAWTMDFRQDRVNVQYDAAMIIERITCG
jgi:Peptidase inhibitor I78 family